MIFYFSGTGNSLDVAVRIGKRLADERLIAIADYTKVAAGKSRAYTFTLQKYERVGFVFPVYAWGPPKPVLDFIDHLHLENRQENYFYAVVTCGKNIGNTMNIIKRHLKRAGCELDSGFSLVMPNNYMIAGDVYPKEIEKTILNESEVSLSSILQRLEIHEKNIFIVEKGPMPILLSGLIHPAFSNQPLKSRPFYATDACNRCGICVKVCTCANIELKEKPVWGKKCVQCLACINYCPTKAIQYGKGTLTKGRYTNPNVSRNTLS
jgi:NAD-dependent dihydropyrimidine dehydrogenase PreA subunit/flavodoxin